MAKWLLKTFVVAFLLTVSGNASAQSQAKIPRVGVIMTGTPKVHGRVMRELRGGLSALAYREGKNILLEPRFAMNKRERLSELAKELLGLKVDIIVVTGVGAARATRKVNAAIPIVLASASDLVGSGMVKSLAKPGGNTTGNTAYQGQLGGKQLELLKEAIPDIKRVGILASKPKSDAMVEFLKQTMQVGELLGVKVQRFIVRNKDELKGAFPAMGKARVDAVIFVVSRLTSVHRNRLIKLAANWKLPAVCWQPSMARKGCFLSYGADRNAMYRNAATFVHRILKGAKPGDLPIEQPTKFGLTINLKTAKAMGITVPHSLLLRADEIIE